MEITDEARELIANEAKNYPRIGARALKEIFGKIIKKYEYDPFSQNEVRKVNGGYELTIDKEIVRKVIKT